MRLFTEINSCPCSLWATAFERRDVIRDVDIPAGPDEDTISSTVERPVNYGECFNLRDSYTKITLETHSNRTHVVPAPSSMLSTRSFKSGPKFWHAPSAGANSPQNGSKSALTQNVALGASAALWNVSEMTIKRNAVRRSYLIQSDAIDNMSCCNQRDNEG